MDLTESIIPRSDQINADDYAALSDNDLYAIMAGGASGEISP